MTKILLVGCGGFCGAIGRYLVSTVVYQWLGGAMPYGTLAVNVGGSFLLGLLARLSLDLHLLSEKPMAFLGVGFLGAFTTFSTFSVQTLELLESGTPGKALFNIILNLSLSLIAAALGLSLGRVLS